MEHYWQSRHVGLLRTTVIGELQKVVCSSFSIIIMLGQNSGNYLVIEGGKHSLQKLNL